MNNRFSRWIQNTTETGRRERAWAAWSAAPEGHRSSQFGYVHRSIAHDVEFGKRQPVRDFFRGAVARSRVKITNTIDRGRSRRAYAEFDRVANLARDLFEAAMGGRREHAAPEHSPTKWVDEFARGLPRETEEERAREGALFDLELEDEWKDHQSGA